MAKRKAAAGKRVNYVLVTKDSDEGRPMYKALNGLVEKFHTELNNARILLAWATGWKADVDGRCTLGKCKKASDLDRELAPFDFVILLNRSWWQTATELQRHALLDHELAHATTRVDREGEPMRDERGRALYRMRKHDLEEFSEVALRWGLYKRDLELMARAIKSGPTQASLLDPPKSASTKPTGKTVALPMPAPGH